MYSLTLLISELFVTFVAVVYSFFNSDVIKQPGGNAIFIAPMMPRVLRCLRFEFSVYGRDIGELSVRDSKDRILWRHVGLPTVSKCNGLTKGLYIYMYVHACTARIICGLCVFS